MVKRSQIEHIIRCATNIGDVREIIIIGSQSILGKFPNPPHPLDQSMEVDIMVPGHPHISEIIDGAIGEGSPFHQHFGYHAHGVDESTAILPRGWQERLIRIQNENTDLRIGWCLDPTDLACAKLIARREKDLTFVRAVLDKGFCDINEIIERLDCVEGHETLVKAAREIALSWSRSRLSGIDHQSGRDPDSGPLDVNP